MINLVTSYSRSLRLPGLIAILSISIACTKSNLGNPGSSTTDGSGGPGKDQVWIQGMSFTPTILSINTGETVTWTNKDIVSHTVTSDSGLFDSGILVSRGIFSYTFKQAGTYSYHCNIHPSMMATVVVTDAMTGTGF